MKTQYHLLPLALAAILNAAPAIGAGPRSAQPVQPILADLESTEAEALLFMREEERLARDVYLVMDELWQALPFANIALSEQKHMDSVKSMMDKYDLTDPSNPNEPGVFANPELQALYSQLIDDGDESYLAALRVGALIEEVDIEDLQNVSAATENPALQTLYGNLLRGSRNHLRAFASEIERQGVVYEAQVLDPTELNAILDTPMERGGQGKGQGTQGGGRIARPGV
ncbi:DUF2202 domain-containing protein [Thiocystis violascens]|uniref:DUF2202 domain-containing protein n=1 Tax=Thiocystis violascens (strain ATCC 17096 / DSM 198 / 6111) TaxID=765911 RepID=I3YFL4_THIV6|nr:DUF2202 domain-containing protein [Thiocystis violascens]AFL75782.1 hypothetical protein Thivi_3947 [Thiocystis violascens DSM 198]